MIVNGVPIDIIGVAPRGFYGETVEVDPPEMWIPLSMQPPIMSRRSLLESRDAHWLYLLARLKPGVSRSQAEAWLKPQIQAYLTDVAGAQLSPKSREDIARVHFQITSAASGISRLRANYAQPLKILMAMVALLLLICCANVANLLLARATSRQHEIATRVALGASRFRIIRKVLTESALLGLAGGMAGLLLAYWAAGALAAIALPPGYVPIRTTPDLRVLTFAFVSVLGVTLLSGLGPAWHTARTSLQASSRTFTEAGHARFSLGGLLVVAQVAICMVLVVVAELFARSLVHLVDQDFGLNARILDVRIDPEKAGYTFARLPQLYREFETRIGRLPGVEAVAYAQYAPFSDNWSSTVSIPGYKSLNGDPPLSRWLRVGPRYMETMGMQLVAGRGIGEQDTAQSPNVAVVNERFVRDFLDGRDPLGMHFTFDDAAIPVQFQIVGVVKDAKYRDVREDMTPTFFLPVLQKSGLTNSPDGNDDSMYAHDILVRTSGDPEMAADSVRRAVQEIDAEIPIRYLRTVREQALQSVRAQQTIQRLSTYFGLLALMIASVGLYGLMMYGVLRRTRELGIRFALGANTRVVISMIMRQSMTLVAIGVAVGLPLTWAGGRIAAGQLYGVSSHDPIVLTVSIVILSAVAAVAALLPARRASQVDPAIVLRAE